MMLTIRYMCRSKKCSVDTVKLFTLTTYLELLSISERKKETLIAQQHLSI
jgi:hypothetical protein